MFVIDGDHLKRWILSRWKEADEPPRAVDILNQIEREGDWMHYAYKITIEVKERRARQKRKTGKWIKKSTNGETFDCCSACGYVEWDAPTKYCPNCGAKMEG